MGQTVDIPVYYAAAPCDRARASLLPPESPPRVEPRGSECSWDLLITDLDVACIPPDCADCQACFGVSFPTASPLEAVPGLNCTGDVGVCYECLGCLAMDAACPGTGTLSPTFRIEAHDPIREGPAWTEFSVLLEHTGDDAATCSGSTFECHIATLEL